MPDDKKTDTEAIEKLEKRTRAAIGKLNERIKSFEESAKKLTEAADRMDNKLIEAEQHVEFVRKVWAHVQSASVAFDDAVPRMVRAEAELGRARTQLDQMWKLIGENAGGVAKLRDLLKEKT